MKKDNTTSGGFGLGVIIFLIFLTLKLAEIGPGQYWSWWWITAPLWIPFAMVALISLPLLIIAYKQYRRHKR
jgi:hypothetical protein